MKENKLKTNSIECMLCDKVEFYSSQAIIVK